MYMFIDGKPINALQSLAYLTVLTVLFVVPAGAQTTARPKPLQDIRKDYRILDQTLANALDRERMLTAPLTELQAALCGPWQSTPASPCTLEQIQADERVLKLRVFYDASDARAGELDKVFATYKRFTDQRAEQKQYVAIEESFAGWDLAISYLNPVVDLIDVPDEDDLDAEVSQTDAQVANAVISNFPKLVSQIFNQRSEGRTYDELILKGREVEGQYELAVDVVFIEAPRASDSDAETDETDTGAPDNQSANLPPVNGPGTYSDQVSGTTCTGTWADSILSGEVVCVYSDSSRYEGAFVQPFRQGQGSLYLTNGSVITGVWKDNKINSRATVTYANGGMREGMWDMGIAQGIHTLTLANGVTISDTYKDGALIARERGNQRIEGSWVNGQPEGIHTLTDLVTKRIVQRTYEAGQIIDEKVIREAENFKGIGVVLQKREGQHYITRVAENGPADRAQLQVGDIILTADSQDLATLDANDVRPLIMGPEGSIVTLEILRDGTKRTVPITRGTIDAENLVRQQSANDN